MNELLMTLSNSYLHLEDVTLHWLRKISYLKLYTEDPLSARITLFLIVMGGFALLNEIYMTVHMSALQMDAWEQLNNTKLDAEFIRNHRFIHDDSYHAKEWLDEKSGIIIEEFESREKFFEKPVHVAHIHLKCTVVDSSTNEPKISTPIRFHLEFSPEEFEKEKRPEFGCTLKILRSKVYHLFKDGELYERYVSPETSFKISKNVRIYNTLDEELPPELDDIQLCFLKLETGCSVNCEILV